MKKISLLAIASLFSALAFSQNMSASKVPASKRVPVAANQTAALKATPAASKIKPVAAASLTADKQAAAATKQPAMKSKTTTATY